MPNYCYNTINISGDTEQLKEFASRHLVFEHDERKDQPVTTADLEYGKYLNAKLDCNTVIPLPEDLNIQANSLYEDTRTKVQQEIDRRLSNFANVDLSELDDTTRSYIDDTNNMMKVWKKQRSNIKKYGFAHWYDFCCEKWGSKWGAFSAGAVLADGLLVLDYDTAWCPIDGVVKKLIEMYPQFSFQCNYEEPGCAFQGELSGSNGVVTRDECWDYNPCEDEEDEEDEDEESTV
ncbi:DUF1281 family ferredoxin-like fold protein [Paraburkholderia aromaticivorans]|uniref:DUF1281 family ferredoxin-like fold protein n=1 Tax=Paraburkholderia aromaticivorans TaxID=2026199 RepID=UPI0038BD7D0F